MPPPSASSLLAPALRWALYLGVSWTWCIGMFLPVLLVRDWGLWAWFSFAIPNILGAAAMGFVLKDADASREMVRRHTGAMVSFSKVTMAYQAFFAGWLVPQLLGGWAALLFPLLLVTLIFVVRKDREFALVTLLTFLASAALWAILETKGLLHFPAPKGTHGATMIAPVCFVGFLLCPYLDLTFHHAFQKAHDQGGKGSAKAAFALGFVVIFGSMILLTLRYAEPLHAVLTNPSAPTPPLFKLLLGTHLLLQLSATLLLHQVRSMSAAGQKQSRWIYLALASAAAGVVCLFLPPFRGWQPGEWVYRLFLAYYALLAPAYVLLRIALPHPSPSLRLLGGTVLTALPFYALGFLTPNPTWLAPGTAILLAGWLLGLATPSLTPPPPTPARQ